MNRKVTTLTEDHMSGEVYITEFPTRHVHDVRFIVGWEGSIVRQSIALTTKDAQALARHLNSILGGE